MLARHFALILRVESYGETFYCLAFFLKKHRPGHMLGLIVQPIVSRSDVPFILGVRDVFDCCFIL